MDSLGTLCNCVFQGITPILCHQPVQQLNVQPWPYNGVTSCNTHVTFADNIQLVPSRSNHPCHLHTTSEIPGTLLPHPNSEVIIFQPWILLLVYSRLSHNAYGWGGTHWDAL